MRKRSYQDWWATASCQINAITTSGFQLIQAWQNQILASFQILISSKILRTWILNKLQTRVNSPSTNQFEINMKSRKESFIDKKMHRFKSPPATTAQYFGTINHHVKYRKPKVSPKPGKGISNLKKCNISKIVLWTI